MTFFTGTVGEVIYNMPAAGAALANTVTKTVISANTATNPPFQVPAPLWQPSYAAARLLKVTAGGTYGDTASTPTLTLGAYLDPTQNSTTSQILLAGTGAVTLTATSITTGNWLMEFYITVTSMGVGSGAFQQNVYTNGILAMGAGNNAATANGQQDVMVGSASSTIQINPMATYFLELWATWGTANASNTITCTQFSVFGLN
jgi:hypothetical protein